MLLQHLTSRPRWRQVGRLYWMSSSSSTTSTRQLLLPQLNQGITLSLTSKVPCHVTVRSQWRDDGQVAWRQTSTTTTMGNTENPTATSLWVSRQTQTQVTSLGRDEALVSLRLLAHDVDVDDDDDDDTQDGSQIADWERIPFLGGNDNDDNNERSGQESDFTSHLTLELPEKINLECDLTQGGSISISSKLEGDVRLFTSAGDIAVKKLRGHALDLETRNGSIVVSELLESQSLRLKIPYHPSSFRIRAKRIHTNDMNLVVGGEEEEEEKEVNPGMAYDGDHAAELLLLDNDDSGATVDISSMYVIGDANIEVKNNVDQRCFNLRDSQQRQAVRVKSHHGHVRVETSAPIPDAINPMTGETVPVVDLGGVNGSCEVLVEMLPSSHDSDTSGDSMNCKSCHVHFDSIAPDSVSLLQAEWGNVHVTVDRKVESDVRLLSIGTLSHHTSVLDMDTLLLDNDDDDNNNSNNNISSSSNGLPDELRHMLQSVDQALSTSSSHEFHGTSSNGKRIQIQTNAFTHRERQEVGQLQCIEFVDGWIENKSSEPDSRFDRKMRGMDGSSSGDRGGGKIRLEGAQEQALQSFQNEATASAKGKSSSTSTGFARPLMAVCTPGEIRLETLSWLGNIARRYGLDDTREEEDLGRQATRRKRLQAPVLDNE